MVRLKHRYLLVNILYPDSAPTTKQTSTKDVPELVQFNRPTSDALTSALLARTIRDNIAELFGDYGSGVVAGSLVGIFSHILRAASRIVSLTYRTVKYLSPATSTAIIRVTRAHYRLVWAALTYINRLPRPVDEPCVFQVVRVSGTIRKSEEEAIRRAKASILRAHKAAGEGKNGGDGGLLGRLMGSKDTEAAPTRGIEDDDEDDEEDEDVEMG